MPNVIMKKMMVTVVMAGPNPILRIFLNEKSSPKVKSRNMTPMSAQECMFSVSMTDMV